jgi:putative DNA primase/helicase
VSFESTAVREAIVKLAELQRGGGLSAAADEDTMAMAFAERHADVLRYVADWGRWMAFDGTRWQRDSTLHVFDLVRVICREAANACQKSSAKSAKTVAAVEKLARSDRRLAATVEQWDADPMLLTTLDAMIDLSSGDGSAPDPLDYCTKRTGCAAAPPGTPHPLWSAFLDRVIPDRELQQFLQRFVGYACTGLTSEHAFLFLYGTGANGKSTFVNTIAKVLGDYATVADMGTFLTGPTDRHPTDLAHLHGARLVIAQETEKGRRWNETKIKQLTGGDKQTARFMRQDFFDFTPAFKLLIGGNHKPRLGSVDEAIRRRLLLGPFTVQIPAAERDRDLLRKLEAEHPAILRWCLDGCLHWQQIGLSPPASVVSATETYFFDQDTVQQWLGECTYDAGSLAVTRLAALFASWKVWCEDSNLKPGADRTLASELERRGYEKVREGHTGKTAFRQLALRTSG